MRHFFDCQNPWMAAVVTVYAAAGALVSALLGLAAMLFFGNFHFANFWHACLFTSVVISLLAPWIGVWVYFRQPTWKALGISLLGSSCWVLTFRLWELEPLRGIVH